MSSSIEAESLERQDAEGQAWKASVPTDASYLFKCILLGSSGTGKSSIALRWERDVFNLENKMTIGVEFSTKHVFINDKKVSIQLWDTAGQERFKSVSSVYFKNSAGALLVFDITDYKSFESIPDWLTELREKSDRKSCVILLVGNKSDLDYARQVSTTEAVDFARREKLLYIETSALASSNIDEAFNLLIKEILKQESEIQIKGSKTSDHTLQVARSSNLISSTSSENTSPKQRSCC